jgi:carboxypeptidase Taq
MLSPAEVLGLSGATLEARVCRAADSVANATLSRIAERLLADASANEMIYERDGAREVIRIMLRPLLAMPEQLGYVNHVCLRIIEALKRIPSLYLADERFRRILAISPPEEEWLRQSWSPAHERFNPVYGRLDAVCDFAGAFWRDSLQFMEPNLSGIGGIHFTPVTEQLVMRDVVPTLRAHDPDLELAPPADQRELLLEVLMEHAKALGREACQLCFVEPKYVHEGPNEQAILTAFLTRTHNLTIAHADPSELEVRGDEVYHQGVRVDVAYRDYELRDLIALEEELGRPLSAMRLLFRQNRVVSSLVGDFDHKSCWEILTDPEIAERLFSMDVCRLFRRHVLWTRVVSERRTSLPHDAEGDLIAYMRANREQLVLKPNRGYGGTGVMIGASVEAPEWERRIEEALALADDPLRSWVVQAATRLPVHEFPVIGADGRVFAEPFYTVMGFAPSENGLGSLCRVSQKQVVNVAQHGGIAALLVARPPRELSIPKRAPARSGGSSAALRARIRELLQFDRVISLLGWDEETMLPRRGREERGEQLAMLEGRRHELLVSDELGDLIGEAAAECEGEARWERELVLLRRLRRHALALSEDLVRAFANARSQALGAWEEARARSDFSLFAPAFGALLGLARERAQALAQGGDLYDALLDEFEPGMTRSRLEPVLWELRDGLVPLVRAASERRGGEPHAGARDRYAEAGQWTLCRRLLAEMGFDFDRGRLDRSTHPFTLMAGNDDVRLTIRIDEADLTKAVLASLHEGGHGLYDQGLSAAGRHWLVNEAASMGVHESQARLWENHVGRSLAFWQHALPHIRELFPEAARETDARVIHRAVNRVRPGPNRVAADELTYHLHILLRYELELLLLGGEIRVEELPGAWNERSEALIGVVPPGDREGVLQDVHWSLGNFGYFPSYSIGSLYAAQLIEAYERGHALEDEIARGELAPLSAWLSENVHEQGHLSSGEEIIARCTGKGLDAAAFFRRAKRIVEAAGP